jgi:hypothetical protein
MLTGALIGAGIGLAVAIVKVIASKRTQNQGGPGSGPQQP